jgi:hypothetical protein
MIIKTRKSLNDRLNQLLYQKRAAIRACFLVTHMAITIVTTIITIYSELRVNRENIVE